MLRALVKSATARAISWSGIDEIARANLHRDVPFVICYHRVVEQLNASGGFALPAMEITTAMLERHLDWLGRHFRIVSLDDLPARLEGQAGSRPLAAVTFDDGYSDTFHQAFPLLRRKGIPAGIFVVTDLVGSDHLPVHERLHALLVGASRQWVSMTDGLTDLLEKADVKSPVRERAPKVAADPFSATRYFLNRLSQAEVQRIIDGLEAITDIDESWQVALRPVTWEMLAEMRNAGMTIGSHSKTHAFLTNEGEHRLFEETDGSRGELKRRLGVEAQCFAYPGGVFNEPVVDAVARAGYRYAFTTCRHRDPQFPWLTIPRTGLWERSCLDPSGEFSPAVMSCQTAGTFNWTSRCSQPHA